MNGAVLQVLLVEDTDSDAELLTLSLKRVRPGAFQFTEVESLAEAAELLGKRSFDVMLLDLSLRDSRGAGTFLRARQMAPYLPIVILTGNEDDGIALEALRHGIEDYLIKGSATGEQIARAIRYAIERTHAEKHLGGLASLLKLFAAGASRKEYLVSVVKFLKEWCGCESVGVRLVEEDGRLPYAAQVGFRTPFLHQESKLSLKTGGCACLRVLTNQPRAEDASCRSANGSFFCNDTNRYVRQLGSRPEDCRDIACVNAGYQSLAHAPLRYKGDLLGSLHLADSRPDKFPPDTITFIEAAALLIAEAVHRLDIEESLAESEERFRSMFERHESSMLLLDPRTGQIIDANPASARFYGYTQEQLRAMSIADLQQPALKAFADQQRQAFGRLDGVELFNHRLRNGETRIVEAHSSPIRVHGRPLLFSIFHDVTERTRLQKQVLEISERERQRVGQDLHDSLGGELAGVALIAKALVHKLTALEGPEAKLAKEIVECINRSIRQTREIARGLCPVELSGGGLSGALKDFAAETERRSGVQCQFKADKSFRVKDPVVALHLFRLATEAVTNAVRHAKPRKIGILLSTAPTHVALEVRDDGRGMPADAGSNGGLGLRTMRYRAESIGGRLSISPGEDGGTVVSCLLDPAHLSGESPPAVAK